MRQASPCRNGANPPRSRRQRPRGFPARRRTAAAAAPQARLGSPDAPPPPRRRGASGRSSGCPRGHPSIRPGRSGPAHAPHPRRPAAPSRPRADPAAHPAAAGPPVAGSAATGSGPVRPRTRTPSARHSAAPPPGCGTRPRCRRKAHSEARDQDIAADRGKRLDLRVAQAEGRVRHPFGPGPLPRAVDHRRGDAQAQRRSPGTRRAAAIVAAPVPQPTSSTSSPPVSAAASRRASRIPAMAASRPPRARSRPAPRARPRNPPAADWPCPFRPPEIRHEMILYFRAV